MTEFTELRIARKNIEAGKGLEPQRCRYEVKPKNLRIWLMPEYLRKVLSSGGLGREGMGWKVEASQSTMLI